MKAGPGVIEVLEVIVYHEGEDKARENLRIQSNHRVQLLIVRLRTSCGVCRSATTAWRLDKPWMRN